MIPVDNLTSLIRSAMCASLDVSAVPCGFHVETGFQLPDGDLLTFLVVENGDGSLHLEDDGATIPDAMARGFDMKSSSREAMLRAILADEAAEVGNDLIIRSERVAPDALGVASLRFISALIRTRDLFVMSRESVAASFADDVRKAIAETLPDWLEEETDPANDPGAPDIVLRNKRTGMKSARIFAAGADLRLMDALNEHNAAGPGDSPVIAIVDRRKGRLSERRFSRALNQGLHMAAVEDMGSEWVGRVYQIAAG